MPQHQWQHWWLFFFFFFYLKRNQESNCLHRVVASVNIVSHEEVVCVWRLPPNLKQLHQVVKLAVDISTDCHRTPHLLNIGLLCQDFLGLNWKIKNKKKTQDDDVELYIIYYRHRVWCSVGVQNGHAPPPPHTHTHPKPR